MTFEEIARYVNPEFTDSSETWYLIPVDENPSFEIDFVIVKKEDKVVLGQLVFFSSKIDPMHSQEYILPSEEIIEQYEHEVKHGDNPWLLLGFREEELKPLTGQKIIEDYVTLYEMSKRKNINQIAKHFKQKIIKFNGQKLFEVEFSNNVFTMVNDNGESIKLGPYAYHKKPYRFYELLPITYFFDS